MEWKSSFRITMMVENGRDLDRMYFLIKQYGQDFIFLSFCDSILS